MAPIPEYYVPLLYGGAGLLGLISCFAGHKLFKLMVVAILAVAGAAGLAWLGFHYGEQPVLWSAGGLVLGAVLGLWETWLALRPIHAGLLVVSAVFILLAYVLTVQVMRMGDAGATAPFRYTGLLWALILGYLAFGEWPTAITMLGAAIVVATGVFTYYRERALARSAA